jgi:hypothetical protein
MSGHCTGEWLVVSGWIVSGCKMKKEEDGSGSGKRDRNEQGETGRECRVCMQNNGDTTSSTNPEMHGTRMN